MERFQNLNQWKEHLHQFFGSHFWDDLDHLMEPRIPAIAIYEREKKLLIYVTLPGIKDPKHVKLSVDTLTLYLKGTFPSFTTDGELHLNEIPRGDFSRKIDLPVPVQRDKATAQLRHGVMVIQLYKKEKSSTETKNIPIEIGKIDS